jgi:hypothetical protein
MIDETGNTYGLWTVLKRAPDRPRTNGGPIHYWMCQCSCGTEREVRGENLRGGLSTSCGCDRKGNTKHGLANSLTYGSWCNLIQRCTNPRHPKYNDYGGRGITVCKRWSKFENFLADMGEKPAPRMSVERKNNNRGYTPSNCVWATNNVQASNRRSTRLITHAGETLTATQWSYRLGGTKHLVKGRLKLGWNVSDAVTIKIYKGRNRND